MKMYDFKGLIGSGVVDRVILVRVPPSDPFDFYAPDVYELWAFNDEGLWPRHLGNRLKVSNKANAYRTWTSLDRAIRSIRQQGWHGTIEIEEPVRQVNPRLQPAAAADEPSETTRP